MNSYFAYKDIELWDESKWQDRISSVFPLVKWMGSLSKIDSSPYGNPLNGLYGDDAKKLDCYNLKTNSVNIPSVVDFWKKKNVHYECRAQGGLNWLIMAPVRCLNDFGTKLPTLVVMHITDTKDPYWAMKILERYQTYNEMVANDQNSIIVYIASNKPDTNRVYVNILQEAFVFVPGDTGKVYLDLSCAVDRNLSLGGAAGFCYKDEQGNGSASPDRNIEKFGSITVPVLNITNRWENLCSLSRDQICKESWSSADFDLQRVIHSESGAEMAEGFRLEYDFDSVYDPGFLQYWEKMGLRYENRETRHHRWKTAVPKNAFENPSNKLPVICLMQEVNASNEHLAVTEASYFLEYFRLAAQGECIIISFVLEDPDSNDLLVDILKEAFRLYPMIDASRVYIAGHSHNGHYALEFAIRNPQFIAAVATFGDPSGLLDTGITPFTEEKIKQVMASDLPLINLAGCCEFARLYPMNQDGFNYRPGIVMPPIDTFEQRVASWQRRLRAFNCPMKTAEEIAATRNSPDKAVRVLGIPCDANQTIWAKGFELYIADIKNNEGKFHLRIVGEENMPHNTTPNQQWLSWSFMRRFARDSKTGKIIELY